MPALRNPIGGNVALLSSSEVALTTPGGRPPESVSEPDLTLHIANQEGYMIASLLLQPGDALPDAGHTMLLLEGGQHQFYRVTAKTKNNVIFVRPIQVPQVVRQALATMLLDKNNKAANSVTKGGVQAVPPRQGE